MAAWAKQVEDAAGRNPMMVAPSPFEEAEFELVLVPVNGGGNGDGENQKAFGRSVEGQKNREWVLVEFWKMWAWQKQKEEKWEARNGEIQARQ
jgi:hypothetical protein